jgi:hypothetical protein
LTANPLVTRDVSHQGHWRILPSAVGALVPMMMPAAFFDFTVTGVCAHGVAYVPPRLQAGFGAPTSVMVKEPGVTSDTVRLAPNEAGSNTVPLSVRYGISTMLATVRSVDVAVITKRCLAMRYSNVPPKVTFVGTVAVAVTRTVVVCDVPFAFVPVTDTVYVPAEGVNVNDEAAVAGATGRGDPTVKPTFGAIDQFHVVIAAVELLVAVIVTGVPAVTVWFWIGLIVGTGAGCTVIVTDWRAVVGVDATPHTFEAANVR